jgi:nitrogen-specific signal transduction histidine kinase
MEKNNFDCDKEKSGRQLRHEINNALAGVFGHTQLLLLGGELNERSRNRVLKIEEMARRIQEIAARIKD